MEVSQTCESQDGKPLSSYPMYKYFCGLADKLPKPVRDRPISDPWLVVPLDQLAYPPLGRLGNARLVLPKSAVIDYSSKQVCTLRQLLEFSGNPYDYTYGTLVVTRMTPFILAMAIGGEGLVYSIIHDVDPVTMWQPKLTITEVNLKVEDRLEHLIKYYPQKKYLESFIRIMFGFGGKPFPTRKRAVELLNLKDVKTQEGNKCTTQHLSEWMPEAVVFLRDPSSRRMQI